MTPELFKNSMRATMEFNENAETVPEIDVHIVKSSHDITIKPCRNYLFKVRLGAASAELSSQ